MNTAFESKKKRRQQKRARDRRLGREKLKNLNEDKPKESIQEELF